MIFRWKFPAAGVLAGFLATFAPFASGADPKPVAETKKPSSSETEKKPAWETARTTSPETVQEMKDLQSRVKEVAKKANLSTVGLLVGQGAGSGVIVTEDGLVLTAAHVVGKPREKIIFVLSDGGQVEGVSLGVYAGNSGSDAGMAKITGKPPKNATWPGADEGKWPIMEMGKSSTLIQGQWLISMGHPGGPKPDRPPPVRLGRFRGTDKFIKTDCTLVGGDSGGPLFDLDGKVVGIHSQIGLFLDMNMHVPMDKFKTDWDRLFRGDSIGVKSTADLGLSFDEDKKIKGAKIKEIVAEGAASKTDLEVGDVITKFNKAKVASPTDLPDILSSYKDGDKVKLTVERDGEEMTFELKLAKKTGKR